MFGIGHMPQIILLLIVALLIFGPSKLPEIGSSFGRGIRQFKEATSGDGLAETPVLARIPASQVAAAQPPVQATGRTIQPVHAETPAR